MGNKTLVYKVKVEENILPYKNQTSIYKGRKCKPCNRYDIMHIYVK